MKLFLYNKTMKLTITDNLNNTITEYSLDTVREDLNIAKIDMWYDRSRKNWVIYPVDTEGNQLTEAVYGFSKSEAKEIKKDLELEYHLT